MGAMVFLGVVNGRVVREVWATTCTPPWRFEAVELRRVSLQFVEGEGNLEGELARWQDGTLRRTYEPQTILEFDGIQGYRLQTLTIISEEDR
jgi:hypothetical protein